MWWILILILVAVVTIKLVRISLFWSKYDLPYEPFPRYVYRVLWLTHRRVLGDLLIEDVKKYGPVYGTYRGITPSLMISDLDLAKEVLIKQFSNFFRRSFEMKTGDPLWDKTISHLPYEEWKVLRSVMGYTFTTSKMRGIIRKLDRVSKRLVTKLEAVAESPANKLALTKYLKGFAMDSMGAIAFGLDLNCIDDPDHPFVKHASGILQPGVTMLLFFVVPQVVKYLPFVEFPPKKTTEFFRSVAKQVLEEKRQKLDEVIANGTADILDQHLIAQRDNPEVLTDDMLASQAFLFVIGGLDTTASMLGLITYYLTVYPDAQQRAYEEIVAVMGDRTEIGYDQVSKFRYLEACMLESLRIAPATPFLDRICSKPTEVAGVKFEKGMYVEISAAHIHKDPRYFPDPDHFLPERFLKTDDTAEQDLSAFLFFGGGPKSCVGRRLALFNMQTLLANLLLRIRLERTAETPFPLKAKKGMQFHDISEKPLIIRLCKR